MIPITYATRREVWRRHHRRCYLCGKPVSRRTFTLDHVRPRKRGGSHHPLNLRPACAECNGRKGNRIPLHLWPVVLLTDIRLAAQRLHRTA